jgi:hypothetical protein
MFGLLLYSLGCVGASGVIYTVRAVLSKTSRIGERSNATFLFLTWMFVMAAPYGWVETLTAIHKSEFTPIVEEVVRHKGIDGDLMYFKVQTASSDHAKLIIVTAGENNWGGTFRNIYAVELGKSPTGWWANSIDPINTTDGDSAGFTLPPYW